MEPSRITLGWERMRKEGGLKEWSGVECLVEPCELKLGFRELDFFQKLNAKLQNFLAVLSPSADSVTTRDSLD